MDNFRSQSQGQGQGQDLVRQIVVGILVVIVLFFIYQSVRGRSGFGSANLNPQVYNQILNIVKENQAFLSFQKDLIEELTKASDKIKALDEFSTVIDQSIDFEGYEGYTGIPYNKDFRNNKFPA